jgi:hypothetical protein
MRIKLPIRSHSDPKSPVILDVPRENLSLRGLEEAARSRFKLDSPLLVASYLGADRERYILSSEEDFARLYDDISSSSGNFQTPKFMVEIETLESFLQRENHAENAEAIKKVILQTHLDKHPLVPPSQEAILKDLEIVESELQRLKLPEPLINQIRNRIVNHWAKHRVTTDMEIEDDSYASNFQSKLGKGRKMRGGFADQSSIVSESNEDNSFFSQVSNKELSTESSSNSQMSIEDAEEMKQMFHGMEFNGHRSMNSDILNWQLEPIMPLSREYSQEDTSEFYDERSKTLDSSSKNSGKRSPKNTSRESSKVWSNVDPRLNLLNDWTPNSQVPSQGVSQSVQPYEPTQTFTKQKAMIGKEDYNLEGSFVSNDFDLKNAKKLSKVSKAAPPHRGGVKPTGKILTGLSKLTGGIFGGSYNPQAAELDRNVSKNMSYNKGMK